MKKKVLGIGSIILLVAVVILGVIIFKNDNENEELEKNITIAVFDKENQSIYNENIKTDAIYLIDALNECVGLDIEKEDSAYGAYITSINKISQGDNFYWLYYIDDEYATVGVSSCKIEDGKTYSFRITMINQNASDYESGDDINNLEEISYDEILNYVEKIKDYITNILEIEDTKKLDIILTEDIYGNDLTEYKKDLEVEDVFAQMITDEKNFVTIIPAPDFLNNQNYYFKDGKLVAYKEEFIGIGGEATYYFENDELLFIDETKVEEEMNFISEDANNILERANVICQNYVK